MSLTTEEPDTVFAFDIDGVLTEQEGMQLFDQMKRRSGTAVGIVTGRSTGEMLNFIEENNLDPDFADATDVKFHTLSVIARSRDTDELVYVGSWFRDRMAARLARWDYRQI